MVIHKLAFGSFEKKALSFTSLKNLTGGARVTDYKEPGDQGDFVNNKEETRFDCDPTVFNDSCNTTEL